MSHVTPRTHFGLHFHIWDFRASNMHPVVAGWPYRGLWSWWSGGPGSLLFLVWLCHAPRPGVRFWTRCRKTQTVLRRTPKGPLIRRSSPRAHRNWSQKQKVQSRSPSSAIWLAGALWCRVAWALKWVREPMTKWPPGCPYGQTKPTDVTNGVPLVYPRANFEEYCLGRPGDAIVRGVSK